MTETGSLYSRRWILGGLLAGVAMPGSAEAPSHSPRPVARPGPAVSSTSSAQSAGADTIIQAAGLGGAVAFVVAETQSGKVLETRNADLAQPPASVAKAMTAFYALDRLGANYRFSTEVLATGPVSGGRLQGDLVLVGSGDPSLDTDRLGDLAAKLAGLGIKSISGRYLVYAGGIPHIDEIDSDQPDYVGYNPAISGLNLNFNRVNFEWKRGAKGYDVSMDARGKRFVPRVSMASVTPVDRPAPLFAYKAGPDKDLWTVSARALGRNGSRWLPVRHPEMYCTDVFATLMAAHGLRLPAVQLIGARPAGTVIAQTQSDALTGVMRDMLKYSTNLTAEVVGLAASNAATLEQSGQRMTQWAADRHGIVSRYVDHSGLAGGSRIAPSQMVKMLRAARSGALPGILRQQGMRDDKNKEIKNSAVRVSAKTGTLNFVSGLAGYIQPSSGKELTFSIFSADTRRRDSLRMSEREEPTGGPQWTRRARVMQAQLIGRWAGLYT